VETRCELSEQRGPWTRKNANITGHTVGERTALFLSKPGFPLLPIARLHARNACFPLCYSFWRTFHPLGLPFHVRTAGAGAGTEALSDDDEGRDDDLYSDLEDFRRDLEAHLTQVSSPPCSRC